VPGETDLSVMLSSLQVERRADDYTYVMGDWPGLVDHAAATVREHEGLTLVVSVDAAIAAGAPVDFRAAWLTLTVWSSLDAVGLTAAVSDALASDGIPCNVIAGYHHDHLLVPADRADQAIACVHRLRALSSGPDGSVTA
jgi:hypothetical protein